MMKRYMIIEGKDGLPVADPRVRHYRPLAQEMLANPRSGALITERYKPIKMVVEYHPEIARAVTKKMLTQHGGYFMAGSLEEAQGKAGSTAPAVASAGSNKKDKS